MLSMLLSLLSFLVPAAEPDWACHPENRWVKQSPREGAPAPRFGWEGSGGYDPHHRLWIHQGGHDGIPQGFHLFTCDLRTGLWEQRFPNTSPAGVCCVDGANVFDIVNRRFVRFPGASLGHGYQWSRGVKLKDSAVWLYDPDANTWTNMRPPYAKPLNARQDLGRLDAAATHDARRGLALSFGGQGNAGGTNNLFVYDTYSNQLQRLNTANPPSPRDGMGLAYDTKNDCLVLFGSQYDNDEKTWIYRFDTGRWEGHTLDPHPPGKKLGTYSTIPKMAYDSANSICLCIVWDTNTNEHQTWAFDAAKLQWTKKSPAVEPDPSMSRSRNLVYDAEHNVFLLELSPKASRGYGAQLWTYRFKTAVPSKVPAAPTNLEVTTAADKATLTWKASVSGVKEYHVYRGRAGEAWRAKLEKIAAVSGTMFEDKNLSTGEIYFYAVRAVAADGNESVESPWARTQSRVLLEPVVSVLARDRVEVRWKPHPAADVVGYNVYRGLASVRTVKKGTPTAWRDNDPEYAEPLPVEVTDLTGLRKLNDKPLTATSLADHVALDRPAAESNGYRYAVYAYLVRAVNRLGTESGPSPYALTIPSTPTNVFNRERGDTAELKWDANPEKGIAGYHVYKLEGTWKIVRLTKEPIKDTTFSHKGGRGTTRYWVVAVDVLGQEGEPSSPVWHNQSYKGFFKGDWHQ
jgi:fibronectin type 3 domain-containing protein